MKKYILVILSVMLILNFTSCTKKDLPVNITIEGKEYQRAFIGELYPLDTGFPDADDKEGIRISGECY